MSTAIVRHNGSAIAAYVAVAEQQYKTNDTIGGYKVGQVIQALIILEY